MLTLHIYLTDNMDLLKTYKDSRGCLTIAEVGREVPFEVQRIYWIYQVPEDQSRGMHANRISYQYLIAVHGTVEICLENAQGRKHFLLDSPDKGLLVPPLTWNELLRFSDDAVLLVMASHPYEPETYINSYEEFQELVHKQND